MDNNKINTDLLCNANINEVEILLLRFGWPEDDHLVVKTCSRATSLQNVMSVHLLVIEDCLVHF